MKKISVLIASALLLFTACDPVERPTYTGVFHRFATIKENYGAISLDIDCTGENFILKNFRNLSDLDTLSIGDRGIASIAYKAVPSADVFTYELNSFNRIRIDSLDWDTCPQDTLGDYFYFYGLNLGDVSYPQLWAAGHYLTACVGYYPNPDVPKEENSFRLYPREFRRDTLDMLIVADIPGTIRTSVNNVTNLETRLLSYDISQIVRTDNAHASDLADRLHNSGRDSVYVHISTCDSLKIVDYNQPMTRPGGSITVRIPVDF